MNELFQIAGRYWPRRRSWHYVSGRRHRRALGVLAAIVLAAYGWWYFTNDNRVRREAEGYLRRLTGASVRIQAASFSAGEGIRLKGVRLFFRQGGSEVDLLAARELWLRLQPMSLLRSGKLIVREIICAQPVLSLIEDVDRQQWNYEPCLRFLRAAGAAGSSEALPVVRIREGLLSRAEVVRGQTIPLIDQDLDITAEPVGHRRVYEVTLRGKDITAHGVLNLTEGRWSWSGDAPIERVGLSLPRRFRQWYDRYAVSGTLSFEAEGGLAAADSRWTVTLTDVSMRLPPEEGGLGLAGLGGRVVLAGHRAEIRPDDPLKAHLPQLTDAGIRISGWMDGFGPHSEMDMTLATDAVEFPISWPDDMPLHQTMSRFNRRLGPAGPMALNIHVTRDEDEGLILRGSADPNGMSLTPEAFPYRIDEVAGHLEFDNEALRVVELTGRRGPARVNMNGQVVNPGGEAVYDLSIAVHDLPMDAKLREALNGRSESLGRLYDRFRVDPNGVCDAHILVHNEPGEVERADVALLLDHTHRASVTFEGFPYRLDELDGEVRIVENTAVIDSLRGAHGRARIRLDGEVTDLNSPTPKIALNVLATDVALDEEFAAALPSAARSVYQSFAPRGTVDIVGEVIQRPDQPLDPNLTVTLKGVDLQYEDFPYPFRQANGRLHLTGEAATVDVQARCNSGGQVFADGTVGFFKGSDSPAPVNLKITAANLKLDQTLRRALGPKGARWWDRFEPSGIVDLTFYRTTPAKTAPAYHLSADLKGVDVTVATLGLKAPNLQGTLTASPGRIDLANLAGGTPEVPLRLSQAVITTESSHPAVKLYGLTGSVAIDEPLLAAGASKDAFDAIARHLRPGGTCGLNINELTWTRESAPAEPPATAATDFPEPAPPPQDRWHIDGRLELIDARVAGLPAAAGECRVNGAVYGTAGSRSGWKNLEADLKLDLKSIGPRRSVIQGLTGRIRKAADQSFVALRDLQGRAYGGRLWGVAEIALGASREYGLQVEFHDMSLDEVLGADANDDTEPTPIAGRLGGELGLRGQLGKPAVREGAGKLTIRDGRIGQVPILLGLVNVVFLQLPGDSVFRTGEVRYLIQGEKVLVESIYLTSPGASIMGTGTINMKTEQVRLGFVSGSPDVVTGVFDELWSIMAGSLASTRVTGSWRDPKTETVPLPVLRDIFEAIGTGR